MNAKQELPIIHHRFCNNSAFGAVMLESIREKLDKHFLQQLWINIQRPVLKLRIPPDLVILF